MDIKIESYQSEFSSQVIKLFEDFQDYLISVDPLNRLTRKPGYAENVLQEALKEVEQNQGAFYVALEDKKVVGFIIGILEKQSDSDLLGANPAIMGRVTEWYVDADYRGNGIGKMLMGKIEEYFKEQKCEYIWVEVFVPNTKTHDLYKKFGFQDRDIEMIKKL